MEKAARLSSNEDEEGAVAYRRLSMRRIREILRLKFEAGLSQRAIARAIGVSNSTVSEAFSRLGEAGLSWPLPEGLGDAELEARLYRARGRAVADPASPTGQACRRSSPASTSPCALPGRSTARCMRAATATPGSVSATAPGKSASTWSCARSTRPARSCSSTHAGKKLPYIDAESGKERQASLFLAVLGASNYTYAEVFENERMESFLTAHVHAFEFYGGASRAARPRQSQNRRHQSRPLRGRDRRALRGAGRPLRRRGGAGAPA